MDDEYAGICGISSSELVSNFEPELRALAEKNGMCYEEALAQMQKRYNGYHFAKESEGVFNPFSVLNTFASKDFRYYWFQTDTSAFLIDQLKKTDFDLLQFSRGITVDSESIFNYRANGDSPVPILYQSGYLTIKSYNKQFDTYTLGFPNEEVEYGFLKALLPYYMPHPQDQAFFIRNFVEDLYKSDVDAFMTRLKAFFADIPYELNDKTERHYQALFYVVFRLMGQFAGAEVRSAAGRADAVVTTPDAVYVFEFKLSGGGTAQDALRQIDEKGYLIPYVAAGKKLVKIGAVFDAATRTLGSWKKVEA
jgi:hypothetical protein